MTKIYPIKLHFKLPLNPEKSVDRVVHTYLIIGEQVAVVDTGVAANHDTIVAALADFGKSPEVVPGSSTPTLILITRGAI